jgi:hypothetical protein
MHLPEQEQQQAEAQANWPPEFPDGVPPDAAKPAQEIAYRLVNMIPPTRGCFRSTIEEFPARKFGPDKIAFAYGTSMYVKYEACKKTKERYKGLRAKQIAIGQLSPDMGATMPSFGPHHITVWFYLKAQPHLAFKAVE